MTLISISIQSKGGPGSGNWGHRGIPGKVGGSSPRGAGYLTIKRAGTPGVGGYDKTAANVLYEVTKDVGGWQYVSDVHKGAIKSNIVDDISRQAGVGKYTVNDMLKQWATTSNDEDMQSLSMQEAVSEEFGVPLSDWQKDKIDTVGVNLSDVRRNHERSVVRAMYNSTQKSLTDAGYKPGDTVTLYRGMNVSDAKHKVGDIVNYKGNAIESWSIDSRSASDFAAGWTSESGVQGLIISMQVPIENIISTAATGFGCMDEAEFVILGSILGNIANVTKASTERS